jgi:hypothetical protein
VEEVVRLKVLMVGVVNYHMVQKVVLVIRSEEEVVEADQLKAVKANHLIKMAQETAHRRTVEAEVMVSY